MLPSEPDVCIIFMQMASHCLGLTVFTRYLEEFLLESKQMLPLRLLSAAQESVTFGFQILHVQDPGLDAE